MNDATFRPQGITFVASYPPRRCGIATFTRDLSDAVARTYPEVDTSVVAMNDRPEGYRYPERVRFEINDDRPREYRLAADFLNMSGTDVTCIQHEFGIFGGEAGRHLLELIERLHMPVVATLHTVLKNPNPAQRQVTEQLAACCDRLVVLSEKGYELLCGVYDIPENKIAWIPHGIPDVPFIDPNYYKDQFGVEGKKMIFTFGLLSPNKGIEHMIEAMPEIARRHPDAVYVVLGATHPGVIADQGEAYRSGLQRRAKELGVGEQVIFVNKFVELEELVEYLGAADVYVTPYLNEEQICSGTLAYAVGAGKAVVSTPYWHAEELLDDGRGRLVAFRDPSALAEAINDLFDREVERHAMRKRAYQYSRPMVWERVATQYAELFAEVKQEQARRPQPVNEQAPLVETRGAPELPDVKLDHLLRLTDDVGIFQHAKGSLPNRDHGYCTDDVARALIAALLAAEHTDVSPRRIDRLVTTYLSFLDHAFNHQNDPHPGFRNFMGYDRRWLETIGSEASQGRAVWALGVTVARARRRGLIAPATELFHMGLPLIEQSDSPHTWAYGLIGIHEYLRRFSGESEVRRVRERVAHRLVEKVKQHATDDWPWMESELTWGSARIPQALLLSGRWMFENELVEKGLWILDWLVEVQSDPTDGHYAPIGCHGFYPRGGEKARFDQQPIEASTMIDACLEAHRITGEKRWLEQAHRCFAWFLGDNDLHLPLYDSATGGCYDGLEPRGVNINQGAESTLAFLLSLLGLLDHAHGPGREEKTAPDRAANDAADPDPAATADTASSPQ